MATLIGVMTCHEAPTHSIPMPERTLVNHLLRLPAIRETWATEDTRFFFGRGEHGGSHSDEVILDCGDSYYETAFKVRAMCRWALDNRYDGLFKVDDDTYVRPDRLAAAKFERYDFVCRVLPSTDINHPLPYAYGGCGYYLSKRMMEIAANDVHPCSSPNGDTWERCNTYEDGWVGRVAFDAGIELVDDHRLIALRHGGDFEGHPWQAESPRRGNDCIAVCEFAGDMMREVHRHWLTSQEEQCFRC